MLASGRRPMQRTWAGSSPRVHIAGPPPQVRPHQGVTGNLTVARHGRLPLHPLLLWLLCITPSPLVKLSKLSLLIFDGGDKSYSKLLLLHCKPWIKPCHGVRL